MASPRVAHVRPLRLDADSAPFSLDVDLCRRKPKGVGDTREQLSSVTPTPFYFFLLSYSVLSETGRFTDYESGQIMCYLHNVMKRLDTIPYMEYMIK